MSFKSLTKEDVGKTVRVVAKIENIYQTSGPTIFWLNDGASRFTAKAFLRPGTRAFPEVEKNDTVTAVLRIQEYENNLEGSISSMEKTNIELFDQQMEQQRLKRLSVEQTAFLAESETLNAMRGAFENAARLIKQAIVDNRTIIIRHNADCDGYSGALALERSIVPLIKEQHGDSFNEWRFFRRLPSKAPYYTISDSFVDVVGITNEMLRKDQSPPLFIIVDTGSSEEDVLGMCNLRMFGSPIIVVNHHGFIQDHVTAHVDVHINPYLFGGDSSLTASMLSVELSRMVNKMEHVYLAALGGAGDKVNPENKEMAHYLQLAQAQGYGLDDLKKFALTIDFAAYYLRMMEGRALVNELFNNKELRSLWHTEAEKRINEVLHVVEHYIKLDDIGNKIIAQIDLHKIYRGEFPSYGKITGKTSDMLHEKHQKPLYVLGVADDMIIFRISRTETQFSLRELIDALKKEFPHAAISGGGHERAGTLRCVAAARDEVLAFVRGWIETVPASS